MARGQRGWWRGGPRPGRPPIHREVARLRMELSEERNLNFNQLGEIEQLSSTVDTQRDELAKAKEDLQQERTRTESAAERENYWEIEFQQQTKITDHWREFYIIARDERISLRQRLNEAKLAEMKFEKQLAMKVQEFEQLSGTVNESACKKLEGENISLKEQITKTETEVKRLQSESLSKAAEVETVKKKMETAAQEEASKMKAMLAELNQVNLKKTREIEHLSNQIAQKQKDYEVHTQQLLEQKELEEAYKKRETQLKLDVAKKTAQVEELDKKIGKTCGIISPYPCDVWHRKFKAQEMELIDAQKENLMLSQELQEAQNNLTSSEAKNKVIEAEVDKFKVENSIMFEEKGKKQQNLDHIEERNQVLTTELEHLKNQNKFQAEDNERHLKILEEKIERITFLETRSERLENEKVVSQKGRRDANERVKALEKETKSIESEKQELKKKLFEKKNEEREMKSKQRMHFAMVDACISNIIKEKETPRSLISSLNLLKRCSQQFIDEDVEKEEPSKKRMKKEHLEKPRKANPKQEIKEEYFEQTDEVLVKTEEEEEEEEGRGKISNGLCNKSLSGTPSEKPILDTSQSFESDPSFTFSQPVEVKTLVSEDGTSNQQQLSLGKTTKYTFSSPPFNNDDRINLKNSKPSSANIFL